MCGRYASARKRKELLEEFRVERDRVTQPLDPDYNVAPTKPVYAVLTRAGRGHGEQGPQEVARELRVVRWGLVPSWARDVSIGSRLINARVETADVKPAFRAAFSRRRCLLPADGFYEWLEVTEQGRSRKQPYYIHRQDGGLLAFAGLYELWRAPGVPADDDRSWLWTATIITTRAQDAVGRIHDRMPMVIDPAGWDGWLDPAATDPGEVRALLAPASAAALTSYAVGRDVNSVRTNGPGLIAPWPAAGSGASPPPGGTRGGQTRPGPSAGPHRERRGRSHRHPAAASLTLF